MTATDILSRTETFEQAIAYALDVLAGLGRDDLTRPTVCPDWNVRDLVLHVADVCDAVAGLAVTGDLTMPTPRPATTPDPVGVATGRIAAMHTVVLAAGLGDDVRAAALQGAANELAVHGWDLATAVGRPRDIPAATAAALLALVDGELDETARVGLFAAAVPVAPSASASDQLVAYLGRRPA